MRNEKVNISRTVVLESNMNDLSKATKTFRLYDEAIWIFIFGLAYLTYEVFTSNRGLEFKLFSILNVAFIWILLLFKIHKIEVRDANTIIFKGVLRKIKVTPQEIVSLQDFLRGSRIVLRGKSLILWPFIERQAGFKALLRNLNPDIKITDVSNEVTKTHTRAGLILLGLFLYFGGLIVFLFYDITHHCK
jgi:hypothetical protein